MQIIIRILGLSQSYDLRA